MVALAFADMDVMAAADGVPDLMGVVVFAKLELLPGTMGIPEGRGWIGIREPEGIEPDDTAGARPVDAALPERVG